MSQPYSQSRALWAIIKASYRAIFAQPTSIVFSLLFPIIFIMIFGAFGNGGGTSYKVSFEPGTDTTGQFYSALKKNPALVINKFADSVVMNDELEKGRLTAVIGLKEFKDSLGQPNAIVSTRTTSASDNTFGGFMQMLQFSKMQFEKETSGNKAEPVVITKPQRSEGRKYRQIDFVLPGQLGFSILFSTLFGIAFTFFMLRDQLVLKRFYASPVKRLHILMGIGMSRLFFQLVNVFVLILFGYFFLNFTLQHGAITVIELLLLTIIMLFLLMGVGLIFSSIAKTDASIPLFINLFGFPQMLLSGTFFPITVFPDWLQTVCKVLPLTQFNDGIRKISFEGLHIWDTWREIGILGIWILVIYMILVRVIKWG